MTNDVTVVFVLLNVVLTSHNTPRMLTNSNNNVSFVLIISTRIRLIIPTRLSLTNVGKPVDINYYENN